MNIYSVNPINNSKKSIPNFSGHVLTKDERGNDVYKFNLPNAPEGSKLEIALLTKNKNGDYQMSESPQEYDLPTGSQSITIKTKDLNLDKDSILGYKYKVNGAYYNDKGIIDDNGYNHALPKDRANHTLPRQMEHIVIDSFNIKDNPKIKRNHFNLLGGTINAVNEKVEELHKFGIRNILGTPLFGQDNKSSHGYWTTNPYQITDNLGTYSDFNNLMLNLYKNDMSWTADGAFVNEGIEGVHLKDMMKWGAESPFLHMFETKNAGNEPFKFGILSKQPDVREHTHIKLVNAPYTIQFEKTAGGYKEGAIKKTSYDPTKPTYIQVFDDRLASEKQINGDSTFNVYDNKDTGDNKQIANYKDAVQAYKFKVSPNDVESNYEKFREIASSTEKPEFKNVLTKWSNFEIVPSNKDGGVSLWVGNSDISKKRFVLPESFISEMNLTPEEKSIALAAQYQVQDDTVQVGKYWTNEVSRNLTAYTAKAIADKVKDGKTYEQAIIALVSEKKLPEAALSVIEKDGNKKSPLENVLSVNNYGKRNYQLKPSKLPQSITDGMMSYPFESIGFSPDLLSVLSYPFIKNMAVSADTVGKSRYELYQMGNKYYDKMPQKYASVYKKMDNVIAADMKNPSLSIMQELEHKTGLNLFDSKGLLTQEGKEIYGLVAPDIAKFLVVSALAPKLDYKSDSNFLEYNQEELHKIDLNSLNLEFETTPEKVADKLVDKIKNGVDNLPEKKRSDFIEFLRNRIQNVNSDSVNAAKLVMEKSESGLNWRIDASKDVGDWDAVEAGKLPQSKNGERIISFWNAFNTAVREHNPNSYIIGELTDWDISKAEYIQKTGFSTISDYNYFYSTLPSLYGANESGNHESNISYALGNQLNEYFKTGSSDNINFMHRFVGNQDKPRILHLLAMDIKQFKTDKNGAMSTALDNGFKNTSEYQALPEFAKVAIKDAIDKLAIGKYKFQGDDRQFDTENFGVRPFDLNIADVIEQAKQDNEDFRKYAENSDNAKTMKYLGINTFKTIVEPAMKKYRAMMYMMAALPGNPTNFAGDEFGETGWETECKNEKQQNRNALHWNWLEDTDFTFIQMQREAISDVMNIRNKPEASALVNGAVVPLCEQNLKGGGKAAGFYRYNDKTDAIAIFHNEGYSENPASRGLNKHADRIDVSWLPNGLAVGTMYHDVLDPNKKYKVTAPGEIRRDGGGDVDLGNAGLILVRDTDFVGNIFPQNTHKPEQESSNFENPHVKLQNMKFNFAYMSR